MRQRAVWDAGAWRGARWQLLRACGAEVTLEARLEARLLLPPARRQARHREPQRARAPRVAARARAALTRFGSRRAPRSVAIDHKEFPAAWFAGLPQAMYVSRKYGVKVGQARPARASAQCLPRPRR